MPRASAIQLCRMLPIFFGLGSIVPSLAADAASTEQLSAVAISSLRGQVQAWIDEGAIVGAEILVLEHGQSVWHESFGLRDIETASPMERGGVFRIRSMTKPILGTVALRLIDRGELSIDDTIEKYLPELQDITPKISVRQLLNHTSGFEFSPFPHQREDYSTLRESVIDGARAGPTKDQGEFLYSDLGSATLGAILEVAGGRNLEDLVQKEVFDTFGMRQSFTRYDPGSDWSSKMNSTHWWNTDSSEFERYWSPDEDQEMPYFRASGGVYSTIKDYAKFIEAWRTGLTASGERFLSEELMELALTKLPDAPYGMHWEVSKAVESGEYIFGHGGSDGTFAVTVPDRALTVLYFTQSRGSDCRDQFIMLAGMTGEFGALDELNTWGWWRDKKAIAPIMVQDGVDLSQFVGTFQAHGEIVVVEEADRGLKLRRGTSADPRHPNTPGDNRDERIACRHFLSVPVSPVDLVPTGENQFKMVRLVDNEIREIYWPEKSVEFQIDDGRAIGYSIDYDSQVSETGRAFEWRLVDPPLEKKHIAVEYQRAVEGKFESGAWGAVVRFESDQLILEVGTSRYEFFNQGAGFFINNEGDVLTIYREVDSEDISLSLRESGGHTHKLKRVVVDERAAGNDES